MLGVGGVKKFWELLSQQMLKEVLPWKKIT
jgi:hypothetical protein